MNILLEQAQNILELNSNITELKELLRKKQDVEA
jgi:hypothetical protein